MMFPRRFKEVWTNQIVLIYQENMVASGGRKNNVSKI